MKKFILFVAIMMSFGLLSACDEADIEKVDGNEENIADNETNGANDENADNDEEEEELHVGDSVTFNDLKITLNDVRIEEGGEFDEPEEDQFVVANLTIENNSDEEQNVSSVMNIELKDEEGYSYNTTFLTEGTKGQLDGSIEPDGKMKGEIPFDVSESDTYELHFSDPFASGKAIWNIASDDLE